MSQNFKTFLAGFSGGLIGAFTVIVLLQALQTNTITTMQDQPFTTQSASLPVGNQDPAAGCRAKCYEAQFKCLE